MIRPAICLNEHKDYGHPMRDFSVINWLIWADLGRLTEQVERYLGSTVAFRFKQGVGESKDLV